MKVSLCFCYINLHLCLCICFCVLEKQRDIDREIGLFFFSSSFFPAETGLNDWQMRLFNDGLGFIWSQLFGWMQNKLNGKQGNKKPNTVPTTTRKFYSFTQKQTLHFYVTFMFHILWFNLSNGICFLYNGNCFL